MQRFYTLNEWMENRFLGPRILRTETAGMAVLAAIMFITVRWIIQQTETRLNFRVLKNNIKVCIYSL